MSPGAVLALVVVALVVVLAVSGVLHAALAGRGRRRGAKPEVPATGRAVLDEIARPRRREGENGES